MMEHNFSAPTTGSQPGSTWGGLAGQGACTLTLASNPKREGYEEMRSSTPMVSFSFSYDTNAMAMDGTTFT